MKVIRKLLMGLLVSVMVLGMGLTAFASGEGSIVISNARNGQEYNAYRVFDFVPADTNMTAGVYTLSQKFAGLDKYTYNYTENGTEKSVAMSSFFTIGDQDILDTKGLANSDDAALFGKAVLAFAEANGIKADATKTAEAAKDAAHDAEVSVTMTGLDYGYYVIDSSLGIAVAVETTKPVAKVNEKNDVPSLDKSITGKSNSEQEVIDTTGNNAQIGDIISFEVVVELKKGGTNYKIVDKMTDGLTFGSILSVTDENGSVYPNTLTINYRDAEKKDGSGFEMAFEEPAEDATVTVKYTATVNKNAVISDSANINKAYLEYGNTVTPTVETKTVTYPVVLKKVIADTDTVLAGAKFNIYRAVDGTLVKFTKVSDTEYKVDPDGEVTEIVTVDKTPLNLNGFDAATYVFVETEAPAGYNLLTTKATIGDTEYEHAMSVVVSPDSTVTEPTVALIENNSGSILPSTGGSGVYIFYIVGGILVAAGVAFFILRRMKSAE